MLLLLSVIQISTFYCASALSAQPPRDVSRRSFLLTGSAAAASFAFGLPTSSAFAEEHSEFASRSVLINAINQNRPESEIIEIISRLKDPSSGRAAADPNLEGEWKLIWSAKADAFSPLLKLPKPLRPDSYQYLGAAAAGEVGEGRISQGLTGGILGKDRQLWLSSGATVDPADASTLLIQPPFRLQLGGTYGSNKPKRTLVEAGSDADFRKLNARSQEAQLAGKNCYKQTYLENKGKGSLRISTITAGDPVIVGAVFVHEKL